MQVEREMNELKLQYERQLHAKQKQVVKSNVTDDNLFSIQKSLKIDESTLGS